MKKKNLSTLTLTAIILSTTFTLSACGKNEVATSSAVSSNPSSSESQASSVIPSAVSSSQSSSESQAPSTASVATTASSTTYSSLESSSESSSQETIVYWTPNSKDYYYTKDGSGHLTRSKEVDSGTESEAKSLGKVPFQGK